MIQPINQMCEYAGNSDLVVIFRRQCQDVPGLCAKSKKQVQTRKCNQSVTVDLTCWCEQFLAPKADLLGHGGIGGPGFKSKKRIVRTSWGILRRNRLAKG